MTSTIPVATGTGSGASPVAQPAFPRGIPADPGMLAGWFRQQGIPLEHDELEELFLFETFLRRHVLPVPKGDVQCMLLWNEWVRTFRREQSGFPVLIREKEFQAAVTGRFATDISSNGARGLVYPGIRFVP